MNILLNAYSCEIKKWLGELVSKELARNQIGKAYRGKNQYQSL